MTVEARLSEPPEIRRQIEQQARAELIKAGADEKATSVTVLSAYKQGYSWLYDVVRPALDGKAVDQITIRFAEIGPPSGWKQQGMYAPTRWLLEIYPIDEILASELKIDLKNIHFEMTPIGSPAYDVIATARGGAQLFRRTFEPAIVERPFFDRFPDYEHVRVTTGWIRADVAGTPAVDERIATDPERFWDRFQSKTLPALYDHVMALSNGKPRAEDAPFFGELTVDLTLSEPEYRLPVDQEQISSMEALHEEIYFNTLHFFDVMGRFTRGAGLAYPGRVIEVTYCWFLQTLLDHWDGMNDAERRQTVSQAYANARRLHALSRDVLDTASIESGELPYAFQVIDLRPAVQSAVDAVLSPDHEVVVASVAEGSDGGALIPSASSRYSPTCSTTPSRTRRSAAASMRARRRER